MYKCSENVIILEDLPRWERGINKGKVNRVAMVGSRLNIKYYGVIYKNIEILNYFLDEKRNPRFSIRYNNKTHDILCKGFLKGEIGNILNIDLNDKYIDDNGVVHIFINKEGQTFEALYSGDNVEDVVKANWYVIIKNEKPHSVNTARYKGKAILLHQVDLGSWVDHINNNPLDCRIENLRKSNPQENAKNKNTKNKYELTGLKQNGRGWYSRFNVNGLIISTKTKSNLEEAKMDNLIAQRYLGYKHNENKFCLLKGVDDARVQEVVNFLENKIKSKKKEKINTKTYNHNIVEKESFNELIRNKKVMYFDKDVDIRNMFVWENSGYWICELIEDDNIIQNKFHREIMGFRPNEYSEYNIHIDHLNNDSNDNRRENLVITTAYGNQCNKTGVGYSKKKNGCYVVSYMRDYKYWSLIKGVARPTFKTEEEAINEVNRRRKIIDKNRVKLKSKEELDNLIEYCFDNNYILENRLADLDLGYLYWKEIKKN